MGATVLCSHAGQAMPTVPDPRVLVSGMPVATLAAPWVVAGCAMPPPIAGNGPCVTAMWSIGAVRVTSLGQPLLIMTGLATCVPTGTPLIPVSAQMRVIAT